MRKPVAILIIFYLLPLHDLAAQENIKMHWEDRNCSFAEFVKEAESLYKVRFFYKEEWIKGLRPVIIKGNYSLSELLDAQLRGTSLFYFDDDAGNVIITSDYKIKGPAREEPADNNFILPSGNSETNDNRRLSENVFIDIGNPYDRNKPGKAVLSGYVIDTDTKEPVPGATVFVPERSAGTMTNEYGYYSLTLPRGRHSLRFSFIGMKEKHININLYGTGEMDVDMSSTTISLKETIISGEKDLMLNRFEVGVEKINIKSFKLLPTLMGDADILKNVLLIPGVQSVGEGSAGFNVRGGSADQNLILLYGAPLYNASHFFGFFSAVNSDIIKDVTLYKGGIPARYGGRISSVLDITAREGNRKEFSGRAGITPVTTYLMVEGPVIKDKCTFLLAGRTTYSNWLFKLLNDPALKNSSASFNDLNGKINYEINRNNKIVLSAYRSHDAFRLNSDTLYNYDNTIISLNWHHFFSSNLFSVLTLNNSNYKYDISSIQKVIDGFILSHRINSTGLKYDFNLFHGSHEFNFGIDLTGYGVKPGSLVPASDSSILIPDVIEKERALETGIYFEDRFTITDYLSINAGLRFSSFFALGPQSVMVYDPSYSKSPSTINDTLNFGRNEISRSYAGPEFRVSLNYRLSTNSAIKLNYNRTRQYLHLLSNTTSISPSDTWKLSDYYLKPQKGDQYAIGFYQVLPEKIEASLEVYYKRLTDMADYKGGTNLIMNEYVEKDLVNVKGKAYGIEFSVKKSEGKFLWSLAYTYARTFLKSTGKFIDEIINSGNWFPANFDKPHDLTATMNYIYSRRISFSANYTYSTGRPITYPVTTYNFNDMLLVSYSDRNKYRIPYYSRLDIALRVNGTLKSRKIAHPSWTFSLYNLLGRENVYSVYFKSNNQTVYGYRLSVFGRTIPSVTYSFDF